MTKKEEQITETEIKETKQASVKAVSKKLAVKKLKTDKVVEIQATEEIVEQTDAKDTDKPSEPLAKSGKRSAQALEEAQEKKAKETRKAKKTTTESQEAKKSTKKPTRSKLERAGKKFREAAKLVDKSKTYTLVEALELATKTSPTKFDATVELHINLNVDPKQADQNIRGVVALPAGTGKPVRVAVLADADDAGKAQKAGADIVGSDELFQQLDKENINFDVLIATPALMQRLSKYARLLGPRGLMPNPKSGTVTADVAKAVAEAKAGRVEYRVDSNGIIHLGIGKVGFGASKLTQNAEAVIASIRAAKPAGLKSTYIKSLYISSTMGPSINTQP
ncbi:50S ribosomal protein L1 [Candidatus Saccharibacteria bacterium CG10_big_fil_rev_8_21_14_0_10_47_8]|nr:MAG: 50S ribosomal protein L1 [Candidatus Saccharibacteria bacterium CG10_big_fil_rev_8_21_14_0_10_47_8]